jgi:hypothetical protein
MNFIAILLNLYIWVAISILLFFLFAIARFYEKKAGRRSFYPAFLVTIIIFSFAALRYLFVSPLIIGDLWGDGFRFFGSMVFGGFGIFLLKLMTGGSRP